MVRTPVLPRIFVQIASYRDLECHHTVKDLFERAAHPERVFVGICWQLDPVADKACLEVPYPRAGQVRVVQYHYKDAKGAGWARQEAQALWQGEEYTLQIQAHMRFAQGWDETLIKMLERAPSKKPVLTAWLPDYKPPNHRQPLHGKIPMVRILSCAYEYDAQFMHLDQVLKSQKEVKGTLPLSCCWVGNFMFVKSSALQEVPSDPHIYFWGEEIAYSARLWTHGYDIFQCDEVVAYHYWCRKAHDAKDQDTYRDHFEPRNQTSLKRIRHLLGLEKSSDKTAIAGLKKFGLGHARSIEDYFAFIGVDFARGVVEAKGMKGEWDLNPAANAKHLSAGSGAARDSVLPLRGPQDKKIFVTIASYRDPECQHTINDLFAKAAVPERVFVGMCHQYDYEYDKECLSVPYTHPAQMRIRHVSHRQSKGANWARSKAFELWQGEDYVLQIDSHMRFEPGWDQLLLEALKRCPSDKPLLTAWLPGYKPPMQLELDRGTMERLRISSLGRPGDAQMVNLNRYDVPAAQVLGRMEPACGGVANFVFGPSAAFKNVPFDPHIEFWGDEINQSARLWTHGWDYFQLDRRVAYHYWDPEQIKDRETYRDRENPRHQKARLRNLHLFGMQPSNDPDVIAGLETYALGKVRSLDEYWRFIGVDMQRGQISDKAAHGQWGISPSPLRGEGRGGGDTAPAGRIPPAPQEKRNNTKRPRIFVAIAAFRDPETQATLDDLFERAAYPGRVQVGICLQLDPQQDTPCDVNPKRPQQVRIRRYHFKESQGANWARAQAFELWEGEEYALQIDSHMRFEQGWDEMLIDMLNRCPTERAVLSTYVPRYVPPQQRESNPGEILRLRVAEFGEENSPQLLHLTRCHVKLSDTERAGLYASPFYIANFLFCRPATLQEVPFDPHIQFWGDEVTFSARLWTHGWDIYQPDKTVIYHYWRRDELVHMQGYRRFETPRNRLSLKRINHLLGFKASDDTLALTEIERYGLGNMRRLDDLWAFAGIDWTRRAISRDAHEGRWNMAKRKNKPSFPGGEGGKKRIFVQIASYRDPDCQNTVKDMFDKAAHPERIFVGICWQFVKEEDAICFKVPYPYPGQVRVTEINARESKGVCWARNLTQQLWQGEEFTLQIDSHMRFEPGWDDAMISMWEDCGSEKAILTCYPGGFTPPDDRQREWVYGMAAKEFDANGIFLMHGKPGFRADNPPAKPIPGAFASACVLFGPASMIKDVPYDPHLYFFGEEIMLAVRLWTHGYDIFHPNKLAIFHDWDRGKRPTHFSDHKDWGAYNDKAFKRVRHLLGTQESCDPEILKEIDTYGLGKARTLEEYQRYSGVDFGKRTIAPFALEGVFPSSPSPLRGEGRGGGDIAPTESAAPTLTFPPQGGGNKKIFVNIASYRDPECQWTVKDLFEKATHPDRIFVGICWQYDPEEDKHCFEVSTRPDQVRMLPVDWREAEGVCWARLQTQQLWDGEEYTLMIDSHMRFMPGWDEALIAELAKCDAPKPVLSCSPPRYFPPNKLDRNVNPAIRRVKPFNPDGTIRCHGEMLDRAPSNPLNAAFLVANFVFSRSEIITEVPYDPYLYFDQEEITYAARLYTHGWDIFSPTRQFMYHYYNDREAENGSVRPLHWNDLRKFDNPRMRFLHERAMKRFNHLTGHRTTNDPEALKELDKYGWGRVRSLKQFEDYSGVDFKNKVATEKALRCLFIKDLNKYRDHPIYIPELDNNSSPRRGEGRRGADEHRHGKTAPTPALPLQGRGLELGDFVPFFQATDTDGNQRGIELYGGKHTLLFFLPAQDEHFLQGFFHELHQKLSQARKTEPWLVFLLDAPMDKVKDIRKRLQLPHRLWLDADRSIARNFGLWQPGQAASSAAGYVLSHNLKILRRHVVADPAQLARTCVADVVREMEMHQARGREQRIITEMPPALIVPHAFTPEFCRKCIDAFKNGETFEGTVGAEESLAYQPNLKRRVDHIVRGRLMEEIDEKLSRSLFPEIKKVFGFDVHYREVYKIGMYPAETGGFFKQHRDNFEAPLGYRRIAMTLHLNDNYDGGGLRFPEYDEHIYRPAVGSAITFSCGTMHEARPVTRGERYVLVGFFHGDEDEAYRRHYQRSKGNQPRGREFKPVLRTYDGLNLSRNFFDEWKAQNVMYNGLKSLPVQPLQMTADTQTTTPYTMSTTIRNEPMSTQTSNLVIRTVNNHQPKKVFESKQAIILDDFLPEDVYQKVNDFALSSDYEYINTKGKVARAWHVEDGFPLRSMLNLFYHANGTEKPQADYVYPTKTDWDPFVDNILAVQPYVSHLTGKETTDWGHFSVTGWIYPHGTGLAMHDDGSGVYSGAYVYFLNPTWRPHWGGLLLMVEDEGNRMIHEYREKYGQMEFYKKKWLHANNCDEMLMEHGFAKCIFPKRNRIVFIANDAYHMVTKVNEQAGDNLRMSLAGFFHRRK